MRNRIPLGCAALISLAACAHADRDAASGASSTITATDASNRPLVECAGLVGLDRRECLDRNGAADTVPPGLMRGIGGPPDHSGGGGGPGAPRQRH
jgi:hypothetical protein